MRREKHPLECRHPCSSSCPPHPPHLHRIRISIAIDRRQRGAPAQTRHPRPSESTARAHQRHAHARSAPRAAHAAGDYRYRYGDYRYPVWSACRVFGILAPGTVGTLLRMTFPHVCFAYNVPQHHNATHRVAAPPQRCKRRRERSTAAATNATSDPLVKRVSLRDRRHAIARDRFGDELGRRGDHSVRRTELPQLPPRQDGPRRTSIVDTQRHASQRHGSILQAASCSRTARHGAAKARDGMTPKAARRSCSQR